MKSATDALTQSTLTQTPMPGMLPAVKGQTQQIGLNLFVISVVGLFLELLLIRWVTTEIRIFAYLQNTVLVVCFLGLGMGCWDSKRKFALRDMLIPLTILAGLLAIPVTRDYLGNAITDLLSGATGHFIWAHNELTGFRLLAGGIFGMSLAFGLMYLLWATFVPVGRMLGGLMNQHPNTLKAYSINVAGSLLGIWLFVGCSVFGLPPAAWFIVFVAGAMFFLGRGGKSKLLDLGLLAAILGFGALAGYDPVMHEIRWSPYQKLAVLDYNPQREATAMGLPEIDRETNILDCGRHFISVNNVGYQATVDLRPEALVGRMEKLFPKAQIGFSQYDVPPKLHPNPKSALVVGSGSGNDVAGMLRNGVQSVVGVEIDPQIIEFGRQLHPEKPYDDTRVRVVNDDARSYFATSKEKFDVIAFGLLDSHTTNAMTNARLDHYVYTIESLRHAKTLLNPGGIMVLSFEAEKPFINDRMARSLTDVFGEEPLVFRIPKNGYGWGGALFVAGDQTTAKARIAADPQFAALVNEWKADPTVTTKPVEASELATDDWPYIYLENRRIPVLYLLLAVSLLALFVLGSRSMKTPQIVKGWNKSQTHFFLLGAAFMLLEVQNISKAAVVLGNTWDVNAVIISGILVMILMANALSGLAKKVPTWPFYFALIGSCIGLYFLDLAQFGFLPYWQKAAVVGLLTSLPMLFSGVIFIRSFANVERKDAALGANLFGSLAGALIQSVTFVTGIKALLLIVAAFYLGAILLKPRSPKASVAVV